jgi:hypothetical protein
VGKGVPAQDDPPDAVVFLDPVEGSDEFLDCSVVATLMISNFLIAFWRVKVLFQVPHEPLAPVWVARLCRAKYCNCNCVTFHSHIEWWCQVQVMPGPICWGFELV